jgi:hypothetical protein
MLLGSVAAVAAAVAVLRYGPALALTVGLASPVTARALAPLDPPVTRMELRLGVGARVLVVDLYRATAAEGALVLVHGLSRAGPRHPELERLARLLAARGRMVLVPHLEGLMTFRLTGREVEEVSAVLAHARGLTRAVGILGFSFGAGPALLAAAEVTPQPDVVGAFGGYADLRHVIRFVTTGVHYWGEQRLRQAQEEYNRWKLLSLLAGAVRAGRNRVLLQRLAARKLANPFDDTRALEAALTREGRALLALVTNRREDAVEPLLQDLPAPVRAHLEQLSPLRAMARLRTRVLIAHALEDSSIPYTESLWLAAHAGGRPRVVLLRSFHHAGPQPGWQRVVDRARDGWELVGLADELLSHSRGSGVS